MSYLDRVQTAAQAIAAAMIPVGIAIAWTGHYMPNVAEATSGLVRQVDAAARPPQVYEKPPELPLFVTPDQRKERIARRKRTIKDF